MIKYYQSLFLCVSALFLAACQSHIEEIETPEPTNDTYTISLGTVGYDAEVETRATGLKTLYGIQVYYNGGNKYAYGLFDDLSKAKITLLGGFTYEFTCTIVREIEGKKKLFYGSYSDKSTGYGRPFRRNDSYSTMVSNEFVISPSSGFENIGVGDTYLLVGSSSSSYNNYYYPETERYYGSINFNPATDGTKVVIPVNKAFFGYKLIAKGVEGGTLSVKSVSVVGKKELFSYSTRTEDIISQPHIHTFSDVADCWNNPNHTESFNLSFSYISDREANTGKKDWNILGSKTIEFKRNVMTTITINVNPDLSGASVGVDYEDFDEDNTIEFKLDENYNLIEK